MKFIITMIALIALTGCAGEGDVSVNDPNDNPGYPAQDLDPGGGWDTVRIIQMTLDDGQKCVVAVGRGVGISCDWPHQP